MNGLRELLLFSFVIVALGCADYFFVFRGNDAAIVDRTSPLGPIYDASDIVISNRSGNVVRLQRYPEWHVTAPFSCAADRRVVVRLLDRLYQARATDVISGDELGRIGHTLADFHLDHPVVRVVLSMPASRTVELAFGSPNPSGDGVYAAVGGIDGVFVVPADLMTVVDVDADAFRFRSVFSLEQESVASFTVRLGEERRLSFSRDGNGWTVNGEKASVTMVNQLLAAIVKMESVDLLWTRGGTNDSEHVSAAYLSAHGLEPERALSVSMVGNDGMERKVSFGKNSDDGNVYALVHDPLSVVTVPSSVRDMVVDGFDSYVDPRLFPVDVASVSSFSIAKNGLTCSLMRNIDGVWRLETPIDAPAEPMVVKALLKRISVLSSSDVDANGIIVTVGTNGVPQFVANASVFGDMRMESIRSLEMINLSSDQVKRIVRSKKGVANEHDAVVFDLERRVWNVEAAGSDGAMVVDDNGVKKVLSAISPLLALRVEKLRVSASEFDDYGLDKPTLTIAIDRGFDDPVRRNLIVGAKTDDGYYATIGSLDAIFVISDEAFAKLNTKIVK